MEQKKIAVGVVPFTENCVPLVSHLNLAVPSWQLTVAVSPSGLGILDKDICLLQNMEPCGIVGTDQLSSLNLCDLVIISPDNEENQDLYQMALNSIAYSLDIGKEVFCLQKLSESEQIKFEEQAKRKNSVFHYLEPDKLPELTPKDITNKLFIPKVPVIGIGELVDDADGFYVLLAAVKKCQEHGLRISVICQHRLGLLFNFHITELSASKLDFEQHIHRLNKLLKCVDEEEKPDVIFFLFPQPMIPFDDNIVFDFGISTFVLVQAIKINYFICCSPLSTLSLDFWESMSQNFSAKFGFSIDAIHLSNRFYDDSEEVHFGKHFPRICFPLTFVDDAIRRTNDWPKQIVFNFKSSESLTIWYNHVSSDLLHAPYYVLD